jgi:predicted aldo/keto reductase-like oxidoreductase
MAAVADGRFDVMLLVYNFIQKDAAERVIKACKTKDIGVTLMKTNPVGKYLNMKERVAMMEKEGKKVSDRMRNRLADMKKDADNGEGFIKKHNLQDPNEIRAASTRYVLANPGVDNVLCRCSTFEDAEHFLKLSGTRLTGKDSKKLAAFENGFGKWYCRHACGLCESSCPEGVQINTIMRYAHYFDSQRLEKYAMEKYALLPGQKASKCDSCRGDCMAGCPHNVPVQGLLAFAHQKLELA